MSYPQLSRGNQPNKYNDNNLNIDSLEQALKEQYERFERLKPYRYSIWYEAKCLAQGTTKDGFFDYKFINKIILALKKIRAEFPEVKSIHVQGGVYNSLNPVIIDRANNTYRYKHHIGNFAINYLQIELNGEVTKRVLQRINIESVDRFSSFKLDATGIEEIDKLNEKYGAIDLKINVGKSMKGSSVWIKFDKSLDILRLIEIYNQLPGISGCGVNGMLIAGPYDETYLIIKNKKWHFVFKDSSRDNITHYYYFTYFPDYNKVVKIEELTLDLLKPKLWLWGIPKYRPLEPFDSYNDLLKTVKSDKWWEKLYALDVIGYLLLPKFNRYGVDDIDKVNKIRDMVISNKIKILDIFLNNLREEDKDISSMAYNYLRIFSGMDYPESNYEKWRKWFNKFKKTN